MPHPDPDLYDLAAEAAANGYPSHEEQLRAEREALAESRAEYEHDRQVEHD